MPKCKDYMIDVPKFYRYSAIDHIMFGYVQGLRKALPSMKIHEAIRMFLDSFEVENNYCFDTAKASYYRMLNAIIDMNPKDKSIDSDMII